jgi:hypothetical protein
MTKNQEFGIKIMLLAGVLASGILVLPAGAQSPAPAAKPPAGAGTPYRFRPSHSSRREEMYYASVWGVDSLSAKAVESGEIIRFSYRVVDSNLAKTVNDKTLEPSLIDPQAGVSLVVPSLEQVGMLRQSSNKPEVGKSYWMAFSNSGRRVKRGDRIVVQIGKFRADGLIVE